MTSANGNAAGQPKGTPLFHLQGIRFQRQGRDIIPPLDLSLQRGKVYGLIGLNGSGKSTLLNLLARQLAPSSGSLLFEGKSLEGYGDKELARRLAYMPQFTPPADGMTVTDLVALGRFAWHGTLGRFSKSDDEMVHSALAATGLLTYASRPVDSLSGGERQRAWLAMMVAQDTGCLLLDEPTSALDIPHQVEMLQLVRRLSRERGLSAIVVLHDINMAARLADQLIALEQGRVIAAGPPEDVMREDVLARIYGLDMGIFNHPDTGAPIGFVK
ncbi:ABC transporter ATP-binding protein [Roseibium sp.]|uniref:ABC transporter ATP-binding protein n=1 Tax=Roseibium sp. TaxID=1936156 RepID=UPI003A9793F5